MNRLGVSSTSLFHPDASGDFDVQLEIITKNRENNNNNNNDALKRSKSNTSSSQSILGLASVDPIKSGDLAHLGFPFDGQIGKDELKESLREAFREMSDVKVKPMNDDNAKKKKTKTKMTSTATTARKSGGDVASLDDAWAKINSGKKRGNDNDANGRGKDETTLEDVMMDVVMANNAKKIGNDNKKNSCGVFDYGAKIFVLGWRGTSPMLGWRRAERVVHGANGKRGKLDFVRYGNGEDVEYV